MRFYTQQHRYYCGVDLHARSMYVCILDQAGEVVLHKNLPCDRDRFLEAIKPFRKDLAVAVECLFCWYWLADLCAEEKITFVLGHALYMKAVHGGKSKNDRIDSHKIAMLLRGGTLPMSYVYPRELRATRDLLRRRLFFARKRAELLAHVQNTNTQYNLPSFERRIDQARNREDLIEHFDEDSVQMTIATDMALLDAYDEAIHELELYLLHSVREDANRLFYLLRSVPGIGEILAMTLFYEIHDISRFPRVQEFLSYARLVKGTRGPPARKRPRVERRWATSTSSGPSRKPRSCSSA